MTSVELLEPLMRFHVYVKDTPQFQKTHDLYKHWALFIAEEGSFEFRMGGIAGTAVQDDMVLCPPGVTFNRKTEGVSFHFIGFDWGKPMTDGDGRAANEGGGFLADAGAAISAPLYPQLPADHSSAVDESAFPPIGKLRLLGNKRFRTSLSQLREANDLPDTMKLAYKSHILRDIFYQWQVENSKSVSELYSENPLLRQAVRLLQQQAEYGTPLKAIAAELHVSQVQLTRRFQSEFRIAPSAYAAKLRMDKVKQLLSHSSLTLAQIAESCGFTDEHHLSKSFKKHCGLNPSVYRRTHRV
ncbi:AraC family transcriptional regulator [Paenibacillus sp. HB172176]|uniref:helix-turn-helix domain-containing protein n=1 Tax=Paenibacillus sp. HB172176 TaxID=2493690 RepID=UPI001F0EC583|nr:AraC family transcriptional regulator [Paenibacillus sp. HB172176]